MKTTYSSPEIEVILVSIEEGACVATSTNENFDCKDGVWN